MAPFSICSECQTRTRKIVKDPKTLKNIYLCPKCFKAKNEQKQKPLGRPKSKAKAQPQPEPEPEEEIEVEQVKVPKALSEKRIEPEKIVEPEKPIEPVKRMAGLQPLAHSTPLMTHTVRRVGQITPPLMQPVVINGRAYVAVSEIACDN